MSNQITYNATLMDEIAGKYSEGYTLLDDAITNFNLFKDSFVKYYDGQVNVEIFDSVTSTLIKHIELLQLCYSNMSKFVTKSKDEMIATDESLSKGINGGASSQKNSGGN